MVQVCQEINICFAEGGHGSVSFLIRLYSPPRLLFCILGGGSGRSVLFVGIYETGNIDELKTSNVRLGLVLQWPSRYNVQAVVFGIWDVMMNLDIRRHYCTRSTTGDDCGERTCPCRGSSF